MDTNVFAALWSGEPTASQMAALLGGSRNAGGLVICAPVYAELLAHPKATQSFVDGFLADTGVMVEFDLEEAIWREVARGFADYAGRRQRSGGSEAKRLLVDFIVGAHALNRADRLISLDPSRYAQDFSGLAVIS